MDTIAPQGPSANTDRLDGFVHKFVKNACYVCAQAREVEHAPLGRRILNTPILLYRTNAGKVVALHDVCPHRFMPMSKGRLVGDSIRCTYHGSLFDETGKCVEIPSQDNIPPKCFLRSYPVVERKNWVWIWMGDPAKADQSLIPGENYLGFGHEDYSTVDHKYRLVKGRYGLCNENLIDDTHISFLHLGQFESGGRVHTMPEVSQEGPWVKSRWFDPHEKISPFFHMLFDVDYAIAPRALVGHFHPPATHVVWIEMYNPKAPDEKPRVLRVALAFTPETETTTHWFWAESRNFHQKHPAWDAFATDTSWAIQDQDFYAIEAIEAEEIGRMAFVDTPVLHTVIVVDADIDVFNETEVLWALHTYANLTRGVQIYGGKFAPHVAYNPNFAPTNWGGKVVIDATRPSDFAFGLRSQVPKDALERMRLSDYLPPSNHD